MGWTEKTRNLLGHATREFGVECTYQPDGRASLQLQCVFRRDHVTIDPETGTEVSSELPVIEIRLEDLPDDCAPRPMRDLVTVPAIAGKHDRARQYMVVLVQRDGEGAARLVLQERPIESVS